MRSRALTRSPMACRLRGLADALPTPTPLTCMRLQSRHAGIRPGACGLSTNSKASISRCKQGSLCVPRSSNRPTGAARGFTSTIPKRAATKTNGGEGKTRRGRPLATLTLVVLGMALFSATTDIGNPFSSAPKGVLNGESFVPFNVISTEQTSPTTFILTVSSPAPHQADNAALIEDAWAHGLWSVEIKQPQLQIARNYTPLPPPPAAPASPDDDAHHDLRFLVRRYEGGEMSTYLSRLRPGDEVYLRGPHLGFDVAARLGSAGARVVFLAGGTGVAPALQVARHLLRLSSPAQPGREGPPLSMEVIWATRSRADCAGCPRLVPQGNGGRGFWGRLAGGSPPAVGDQEDPEGLEHPVVRELRGLQAAFRSRGHELEVRCVADDEAGAISGADVTRAVEGPRKPSASVAHSAGVPAERASCYYHSQQLLQNSTNESDVGLKGQDVAGKTTGECACGRGGANGKNLLMISGPDGFTSAYVGPKVWADGAERQGPVGGLVRKLMQKNPEAWRDWLILKQ